MTTRASIRMPGDPRVLGRRMFITVAITAAVAFVVGLVAIFAGGTGRIGILWIVLPALVLGGVTTFVWWRRAKLVSRQVSAAIFEGVPPLPAEAAAFGAEVDEIRSLVYEPGFWRRSMRFARWGTGARCRELADDALRFELPEVAGRLLVLADALDPGRVDPGRVEAESEPRA